MVLVVCWGSNLKSDKFPLSLNEVFMGIIPPFVMINKIRGPDLLSERSH